MEIRQWWWNKTHYEEKMDVKSTNNNGTFTSEPLDISLKPGDHVLVRTLLPLDQHPMSQFVIVYQKRWYVSLKRVLRRTA